jgi:aryl-alcohol dehydrogenase-like predicted oxidoreductase
MSHLEDNLGAAEFTLPDDQMARLTEVSAKRLPYPYGIMKRVEGERGHG